MAWHDAIVDRQDAALGARGRWLAAVVLLLGLGLPLPLLEAAPARGAVAVTASQAEAIERTREAAEQLEAERRDVLDDLARAQEELSALVAELEEVEAELAEAETSLAEAEEVLAATSAEGVAADDALRQAHAALAIEAEALADRARAVYQRGSIDRAAVWFDAGDLTDYARRDHIVRLLLDRDAERVATYRTAADELETSLAHLEQLEAAQRAQRDRAAAQAERVADLADDAEALREETAQRVQGQEERLATIDSELSDHEAQVVALEAARDAAQEQRERGPAEEREEGSRQDRGGSDDPPAEPGPGAGAPPPGNSNRPVSCTPPASMPVPNQIGAIWWCRLEQAGIRGEERDRIVAEAVVVARCESGWNPQAVVFGGRYRDVPHPDTGLRYTAAGVFQFIDTSANHWIVGGYANVKDPIANIDGAARYFLDRYRAGGRQTGWSPWACAAVNDGFATHSVLPGFPGGPARLPDYAWQY